MEVTRALHLSEHVSNKSDELVEKLLGGGGGGGLCVSGQGHQ